MSLLKDRWSKLKNQTDYDKLMSTGMFFEIFPELTGNYRKDKKIVEEINIIDEAINRVI